MRCLGWIRWMDDSAARLAGHWVAIICKLRGFFSPYKKKPKNGLRKDFGTKIHGQSAKFTIPGRLLGRPGPPRPRIMRD